MSGAFGEWDVPKDTVVWSPSLAELIGAPGPAEAVPSRWWRERIHPEDAPGVSASLAQALAGDASRWSASYRARRADGGYVALLERAFVIRAGGRPIHVVSALDPLTEAAAEVLDERSLLERLQRSEGEFRTFVESIAQLAWTARPDGWLDYYNQRWYEYTGTTPEQMAGWGWVDVHDPQDLPRMLAVFRRALDSGTPWEDEFRLRRKDGAMRWHLSRAMPVRDAEGRVVRWFGTNTDVHDQKLALEERSLLLERERRARAQAEEASRAKDEFLAIVSHELRTPLNAIVGWSSLLQGGRLDEAQRREAVETIARNARQQSVLIDDLLDTSRILGGRLRLALEPTAPAEAVRAAVESLRPRYEERGVGLELEDRSEGALVLGDAARLQQIATNLLDNACKFSPPGSRVRVRLEADASAVHLSVHDEGEGIEAEVLPQLFHRFRQADSSTTRRHGGLGLGLSIVRQLVELHGGSVRATSAGRGQGTRIDLRLPRAASTSASGAEPSSAPRAEERATSLRGLTVLAVDDDPDTLRLLAVQLLACGATVLTAGSVAEALEALRGARPDLVLSDIAMPEVDGFGLVERVRTLPDPELAGLPMVALTAFASLEDRQRALAAGFDAHHPKPVDLVALSRSLAELLARRRSGRS